MVGPCKTVKLQFFTNWLKIGTLQPKFHNFFFQFSQPLYYVMQKEIENPEFVQRVELEFVDSVIDKSTEHLLIFDESCGEICNLKAFADIATSERHRGFSTIYIEHNLFKQSKLGQDVQLQNTHMVLFKSPSDVMQVKRFSAQLGLGSELVDWYRGPTFMTYGHLLIDLLPRMDNRLDFCTNTGSIPSKFCIPERLKQ